MPFDGIVTKAVVEELNTKLMNGRISRITQPTDTEVLFTIRNNRQNYRLLFSIHPTYARFHLTNDKYDNPQVPLMFCTVLRKHLSGAVIESIEQDGLERIITIELRAIDEIGDMSRRFLVMELMGRHSNVFLLNEDQTKIVDSLKHVSSMQNRYRTILPGHEYIAPPSQNKLNPLTVDENEIIKKLDFNKGQLDRQIVRNFDGISPFFAKEIVFRAELGSTKSLKNEFLSIRQQINEQKYEPTIFQDKREDFHVISMTSLKGDKKTFPSTNDMLDQFYSGKAERDRVKQRARDLYRFIKNELDKNERKLKIHENTLKKAAKAEHYKHTGELLTAHMHMVKHGDDSVTVVDYYDPNQQEITIPLQTDKTPSENAQALFTRYRKLSNSKRIVKREIAKTKQEIAYLEQLVQQIDSAREADIDDIREELREEGYLKKQKQGKRKVRKPKPEEYISTDGTTIFVGRNNKQNEYVTHRIAHRNDIWLHTKDIPGSHVVIRSQEPTEATLLEAAELAAYFSRAKGSSSVPVDYTQIRHVNKPRGAKPGFVTYVNEKTVFVTPKEEVVKRLKNEN